MAGSSWLVTSGFRDQFLCLRWRVGVMVSQIQIFGVTDHVFVLDLRVSEVDYAKFSECILY